MNNPVNHNFPNDMVVPFLQDEIEPDLEDLVIHVDNDAARGGRGHGGRRNNNNNVIVNVHRRPPAAIVEDDSSYEAEAAEDYDYDNDDSDDDDNDANSSGDNYRYYTEYRDNDEDECDGHHHNMDTYDGYHSLNNSQPITTATSHRNGWFVASTIVKVLSLIAAAVCITTDIWTNDDQLDTDTLDEMEFVTTTSGGIMVCLDVLAVPFMALGVSSCSLWNHHSSSSNNSHITEKESDDGHNIFIVAILVYLMSLIVAVCIIVFSDYTLDPMLVAVYMTIAMSAWLFMLAYVEHRINPRSHRPTFIQPTIMKVIMSVILLFVILTVQESKNR